jgi:hypothetical protein
MDKPAMDKPVTTWKELRQKIESQNKQLSLLLSDLKLTNKDLFCAASRMELRLKWPDPIEVPRRLPVPIALADGHYPGPGDASDNGCVYGGVTLRRDPLRWQWHFTHYLLLEHGGFTHWLPPDVECLPAKVEP